jgi:hypothetical protein
LRARAALLLAGDFAAKPSESWPESAWREADAAVANLKKAVDRGYRGSDVIRASSALNSLLGRADVKEPLGLMDRPAVRVSSAAAGPKRRKRAINRRWTSRADSKRTESWAS